MLDVFHSSNRRAIALAVLLISVISVLAYATSLRNGFICDDKPGILENKHITSWEYVPGYFTKGLWDNVGVDYDEEFKDVFLYRPLVIVDIAFRHLLFGSNPLGYHVSSILLHTVNAVLVFFLIRKLVASDLLPALAFLVEGFPANGAGLQSSLAILTSLPLVQ